ncbi:MAG TPA: cation diffusion facilitator family transporter [Rhodothermia bacterium]|nr:cation diffusion facilitator family transporter [Rhodothermia bacterium]
MNNHNYKPDKALAFGVLLNVAFAGAELLVGFWTNSLALISDAAHNFTDVIGLGLAWSGVALGRAKRTPRHTFGFQKASILAALFSSLLIVIGMGFVVYEAVGRLGRDVVPVGGTIMIVAGIGVLINAASAYFLFRDSKLDLNIRGAFVHMVGDAAVSVGVVIAGFAIRLTAAPWIDPIVSIIVAVVIVVGTRNLLRDSLNLAVDGVPKHIDVKKVRQYLTTLPGVRGVHDLHIWGASTTETVLTAHLVAPGVADEDELVRNAVRGLEEQFDVGHATLQIEKDVPCPSNQACDEDTHYQ